MADDTFIEGPLYAPRKKVYPQSVQGRFRRIKWAILGVTLGTYYLLPFVRCNRGPGLPDQAVLIDFPHRRFYFFFIELWPQEVYYFTGLLILAAMTLFLMNAVAGRLWCGYLCPQTVWTDLFYAVERWIEGDRRERMIGDKAGWTFTHIRRVLLKNVLWLMIAWWTGGAWVLYFADAPTLVKDLATF
jgi:cytochrome c oxidase accessory protein FixG